MLNNTQLELLNDWVILLSSFQKKLTEEKKINLSANQICQELESYLNTKIIHLNFDEFDSSQVSQWQTWQTETHRLIRLLKTDLLFLASAKQDSTRESRLNSIQVKLHNLIHLTEIQWDCCK